MKSEKRVCHQCGKPASIIFPHPEAWCAECITAEMNSPANLASLDAQLDLHDFKTGGGKPS